MALITRVSRLFRADVNAVLDRIEEPEILLKQAVREMEESLAKEEQQIKLIGLDIRQIESRQSDLAQRLKPLAEELDLCFDSDNHALARSLLKRKLESERYGNHLAGKRKELQEALAAGERRIEENRARLESMRQKVELLADQERAETHPGSWSEADFMGQFTASEDEIELAFLRENQRRSTS